MPNNIIKTFANKSNKSEQEIENLWNDLKKEHGDNYNYIVGTLKKILKINENTFIDYITESRKTDEYGIIINGELLDVSLKMSKNNLIQINVNGKRTLPELKSIEILKKEYEETSYKELEKFWSTLSEKNAKLIENLVTNFEKNLNDIIINMQKEVNKL